MMMTRKHNGTDEGGGSGVGMSWVDVTSGTHEIPLEYVRETDDNARKTFDEADMAQLAESLRVNGQIEPVIVHPIASTTTGVELFQLYSGARRVRALQRLGKATVRAEVRSVDSLEEAHRLGLLANIDRTDLSHLEMSAAYVKQMELGGYKSVREMAAALGRPDKTETIRDHIKLGELVPDAADALRDGEISYSHAVLISQEKPSDQQRALAACFVTETVTIGLLPETSARLITEKALRSWIQTHLREPADDQKIAEKTAEKRAEAEVRGEGERALEKEGERLAGGDPDDLDDEDGEEGKTDGGQDTESVAGGTPAVRDAVLKTPVNTVTVANVTLAPEMAPVAPSVAVDTALREEVNEMVSFLKMNFGLEWNRGQVWNEFARGLLNELIDLRDNWMRAPVPIAKGKVKKAKKLTQDEIDIFVETAARKIVDGWQIDDTDVTSMRETGMTDKQIANLIDAYLEGEKECTLDIGSHVFVTFDAKHMELFRDDDDAVFAMRKDTAFVFEIRHALEVPEPTELHDSKKKKAKKTAAKGKRK